MITRRGLVAGTAAMASAAVFSALPGDVSGVARTGRGSGSVWGRLACLQPGAERWLDGDYPSGHLDTLLADAVGVGRLLGPAEVKYYDDLQYEVSVGSWEAMRDEFSTVLRMADRVRLGVQGGVEESRWLREEYGERPDLLLAAVHPEWVFAFRLDGVWGSTVGGRLHRLRVDLDSQLWLVPRGVEV